MSSLLKEIYIYFSPKRKIMVETENFQISPKHHIDITTYCFYYVHEWCAVKCKIEIMEPIINVNH